MRLGAWKCSIKENTLAKKIYGKTEIMERHRHRYEVNNAFRTQIADAGLSFSGLSPDGELVEYVELPREVHPYYISTQAHPELRSRPGRPHPQTHQHVGWRRFRSCRAQPAHFLLQQVARLGGPVEAQ